MTENVRDLLEKFEALSPTEQLEMTGELFRRWSPPKEDLPDAAFDELAGELFRGYDVEEASRAAG